MPLIWCSISGHGFGHAAQVVPVLNELGARVPHLHAILRTTVPASFFQDRLSIQWELSPVQQDIGCVQQGPLKIDVAATWSAYEHFHKDWAANIRFEAEAISARRPNLVLSNISHLAIQAGKTAGIRTVALGSLSWDRILQMLDDDRSHAGRHLILQQIHAAYTQADLLIRLTPGLPMPAFKVVKDVGPVTGLSTGASASLRRAIGASPEERVVLIGFGGIALDSMPVGRMNRMPGYRFVVDGPVPDGHAQLHSTGALPFPFGTLLASTDIIMSKPGYGTIVEAVAQHKPVVYVRRYNFAEEAVLVDYLHRHGRGAELMLEDFSAGRWEKALDQAWSAPLPSESAPSPTGASETAILLAQYL